MKVLSIVLGSSNEPKRQAVHDAFTEVFPGQSIDIDAVDADSAVSDHPISARESLAGAVNRAKNAKKTQPGADYYVGIEGGLLEINGRFWEHGFVAIEDKTGELNTALSAGLEIKGRLLKSILEGEELSKALATHFELENAGKSNGFYGIATNDLITRVDGYRDAVIFALAPFKNPKYFK